MKLEANEFSKLFCDFLKWLFRNLRIFQHFVKYLNFPEF